MPPVWVCSACGHGDASDTVDTGEVQNEAPERASQTPSRLHQAQIRIAAACSSPSQQVIDIGCANGAFLRHASDAGLAGPTSYGLEISEANAATARSVGLRIEPELGHVDAGALLTSWHSAEHFAVPALIGLWRDAAERSGRRASLLVSVPNGGSLQARAFGSRWAFHDPEAHLSVFTQRSLSLVLGQAGYRPVRWFRTLAYGGFSAIQSSLNLLRPRNQLYDALKRGTGTLPVSDWLANAAVGALVSPVAALSLLPEMSTRWASVLTVHAIAE